MYKLNTMAALAAVLALAAFSAYAGDMDGMQKEKVSKAAAQIYQGRGTVNKLDLDAGKVNISHDAIKSLQWTAMTMDFKVQDKSVLAGVKPGMKVDFEFSKFADGYRISRIVPAKK